jgi:hypothetical protein
MIAALAVALLAAAPETPAIVSVHAEPVEGRTALEVVTTAAPVRVRLDRVAQGVALTLDARLPRDLGPVEALPPLRTVEVARVGEGVVVRVGVDEAVPYEVRRQGTLLSVLFGKPAAAPAPGTTAADVQDLYRGLVPPPTDAPPGPVPGEAAPLEPDRSRVETEGLQLGALTLRPQVSGVYVDSEGALLETAQPVPDQYYEVRPRLAAELPVGTGRLIGDYEARLRRGSSFAEVDEATTHLANASLELPVGPSVLWRANGHFAHGLLETTEVDPGREYFFQLAPYTRYDAVTEVRIETGSRLDLDLTAGGHHVDVDEQAGFFDHEGWTASAGLGVEMGPRLRAVVRYMYEEIPLSGTERPEAAMDSHSAAFDLQGEIMPLVTGTLTFAYRDQRNPAAGEGGQRYQGLGASVRVLKEFTRTTTLQILASRATPPSAFEDNGFFVASSVGAELNLALPLSLVALGGGGYHRNQYRVVSPEIGAPREDNIVDWVVGLGRPLGDWAFVRADYRHERRDSNLDAYDTDAHSLTVQVGLRLYRSRGGR